MNKILVIAAHPDDEVLGCGGMIARMDDVSVLFLGQGRPGNEMKNIDRVTRVNKILGFRAFFGCIELKDNMFDERPLKEIIKQIEDVMEDVKPNTIFTHYRNDLNVDHRIAYQATITAARPKGEVKEIYSYEVPTSTNWGFPISFSPNFFIDITDTVDEKVDAMETYDSETNPYRKDLTIYNLAMYRGYMAGCDYAEAFETVRRVI